MPICIVGDPRDLTAVYVAWLARRRGMEVIELNEELLGVSWAFDFNDTKSSMGKLNFRKREYRLSEFCGAFVRLNPQPRLPKSLRLPQDETRAFIVERRCALQQFLNSLECIVANRPCAGRSNGSKPYQMRKLTAAGFRVPKWMVTNEEVQVTKFARQCTNGIIYKSCSGLRPRVRLIDSELLRRLRLGTSPVVIQEYIAGKEVRIHVVKSRAFGTEVISKGIDYRFDGEGNRFRPTQLASSIVEMCCQFASAEGLAIAGFDFRVTQNQQWYCLEMNPVPTFLPYEIATSQPIGNALLDILGEA